MPDKWQALQQFWENFGLPVYDENTVAWLTQFTTYEVENENTSF